MVERVTLYRAPTTVADVDRVGRWLGGRVDASVAVADRFLAGHAGDAALAEGLAGARVLSPYDPETGNTMLGTVRYEERVLADPDRGGGVLYDGLAVQALLRARLPDAAGGLDHLHVVVLDRALATWGDHDGRWHKRISVLGQPALVSVPGLSEAPAKPEAYYRLQQSHAVVSGGSPPREVLEAAVEGDLLAAGDPRTTAVMQGAVLQAYHYLETGEAFCDDARCRLFNAHRHGGLLRAQLEDPPFCDEHAALYG